MTPAQHFKASDLIGYSLSILEPLRDGLSQFCLYKSWSDWTTDINYKNAEYKKDIKPIFKSIGLEKGDVLREKLKTYIKESGCYHTCFNRIVSILNREINARRDSGYVLYTYCKPITVKYLKNYYKNESIQS